MRKISKRIFLYSSVGLFSILSLSSLNSCATKYNVKFNSVYLDLVGDSIVTSGKDYKCSFKIKDDALALRYMDNIDVDTMSVKVGGQEIDTNNFSFIYQTNAKNEFTIQGSVIKGDIEITANMSKRTQKQNCFYFEYDINDYVNFSDFKVTYPTKQGRGEAIDDEKTKMNPDDIYLKDGYDIAILNASEAKQHLGKEINLLILREDNAFEVNFKSKDDKALPKNIWFRSNARYTKKGEDFTLDYAADYKSATLKVPYFFIRDNGSFRLNPDVEA